MRYLIFTSGDLPHDTALYLDQPITFNSVIAILVYTPTTYIDVRQYQ